MTGYYFRRPGRVRGAGGLEWAALVLVAALLSMCWCHQGWAQQPALAAGSQAVQAAAGNAAPKTAATAPVAETIHAAAGAKPTGAAAQSSDALRTPAAVTSTQPAAPPVTEPAAQPKSPPVAVPPSAAQPPTAESTPTKAAADTGSPAYATFNFRFQPWEDVLEWFAEQAGYSLVMDAAPPGTFNYTDSRKYTPAESIDLLNSILLTKGYTLVLRDRMLMLVNLEDGVPPNLVDTVPVEELGKRGEYELVSCLFRLQNLSADDAKQEVEKLIGPQGSVVVLPKARQILVTETAGKLRTIEEVIKRADGPDEAGGDEKVQWFELHLASAEEVLTIVRQLFNIPADQTASADGSIRFALDPASSRLLVSGNAKKVEEIGKVLQIIDRPGATASELAGGKGAMQLEVYDAAPADSDAVLKVLQTLLAGRPGVRLSTDPKTGNIIALARPEDHATIRATIDQMKRDVQRMEVFRLRTLDPQLAVLSIGKLFASEGAKAPSVDADPAARQLFVRGSQSQIDQIRSLLEKMGEPGGADFGATGSNNVRMIPLSGQGLESALNRLQQMWPLLHPNPIRVLTPSGAESSLRGASAWETGGGIVDERPVSPQPAPKAERGQSPSQVPAPGHLPADRPHTVPSSPAQPSPKEAPTTRPAETTRRNGPAATKLFLTSEAVSGTPESANSPSASTSSASPDAPKAKAESAPNGSSAPIVVTRGPGGIMIASEDAQALDDFERLLRALAGGAQTGPKVTVFYLKYGKAQVVASTLSQILSGSAPRSASGGPPAAPANPATPPTSAAPGGVLGYILGPGGSGNLRLTGSVQVTPDPRLNALFVQASPSDVAVIEQLLKVLDQREGPEEILAQPKPRLIPVYNTQATEVAEIVRQVYQDRMVTGGVSSGRGGGFNPVELFQMMRGRGGDSQQQQAGAARGGATEQVDRLSIGIDARTNSLIVCAPDPLFQEVKQLVGELDQAATQSNETVGVVSLHGANPEVVQQALATLMGGGVQVGSTSAGTSSTGSGATRSRSSSSASGRGSSAGGNNTGSDVERMQRRLEFFRSLRGSGGSSR